ncbi:hypothetical protein HK103_001806 [Boothiomyces macroporosus]|uniref:SGNH hydrolase-type esterase domain-containing protein n=1 Tax=Boothiomyces macroporosus TaxID=261099 RepID=A0AAD5Y4Q3_9FUNG|nr:hypothetical protein HK103_001806 [Boothiomyces macroporosus]
MGKKVREKTVEGGLNHLKQLHPTDKYLILGDSHTERLQWRFPQFAPNFTWLCGVGGDTISQLAYRIKNDNNTGYVQSEISNRFQVIVVLVGTNNCHGELKLPQVAKMVNQVQDIVDILKERWPESKLVVLPIPPYTDSARMYNQALLELGMSQYDWNDIDPETDFEDHVHLNENGYRKFLSILSKCGIPSNI